MPAKPNVTANGPTSAIIGAARGDRKEEWDSNSAATFHTSPLRAGIIASKRAPAGTTLVVANRTILPVDGYETTEVDLDQPILRPNQ